MTATVTRAADRETALRRGDELWERLRAALDGRLSAPVYGTHDWTGHDVYAHFGRWQEHTLAQLHRVLAGRPPAPEDGTEAEINERWVAEDRSLPVALVRDRCLRGRQALRDALMALTQEQWDRFGHLFSPDVDGEHYEQHLQDLLAPAP